MTQQEHEDNVKKIAAILVRLRRAGTSIRQATGLLKQLRQKELAEVEAAADVIITAGCPQSTQTHISFAKRS